MYHGVRFSAIIIDLLPMIGYRTAVTSLLEWTEGHWGLKSGTFLISPTVNGIEDGGQPRFRLKVGDKLDLGRYDSIEEAQLAANVEVEAKAFLAKCGPAWVKLKPLVRAEILTAVLESRLPPSGTARSHRLIPGFLYVVEVDGFLKFGYTSDPSARWNTMTSKSRYISILTPWGAYQSTGGRRDRLKHWGVIPVTGRHCETEILRRFDDERVITDGHGRSEWFPVDSQFFKFASRLQWLPFTPHRRRPLRTLVQVPLV
jgi:hypothetical protein